MISRIKRWIYSKFFLFDDEVSKVVKQVEAATTCTRDAETRKRVAKAFKEQEKQMQARSMKAHDPKCEDPISCKKTFCYQWAPDKVVKVEIEEVKRRGRPKKVN